MSKPDTIIVDGHAYRWQELCELRRQQLEARKASRPLARSEGTTVLMPSGRPRRYHEPTRSRRRQRQKAGRLTEVQSKS